MKKLLYIYELDEEWKRFFLSEKSVPLVTAGKLLKGVYLFWFELFYDFPKLLGFSVSLAIYPVFLLIILGKINSFLNAYTAEQYYEKVLHKDGQRVKNPRIVIVSDKVVRQLKKFKLSVECEYRNEEEQVANEAENNAYEYDLLKNFLKDRNRGEYKEEYFNILYEMKKDNFKWYVEKLYGWDEEKQIKFHKDFIEEHRNNINVIKLSNEIIGIFTNYIDENNESVISLFYIDKKYQNCNNSLKSIYYELQELSRDVCNYKDEVDFDEEERNNIEERLDLIYSLKRKYGNNIEEILNYKTEIEEEINRIENIDEYNNKLKEQMEKLEEQMNELGQKIHNLRKENSQTLSKNINQTLKDLEMPNAKINIHVDYKEKDFFETGKDQVEIYITTNLGEDEKPLIKIASGGEMSRIMLAIKKVLAEADKMSVLVFDEIDTGISGKAANAVAEKLSSISKNHQVICISHLASIAAKADYNYFISKNVKGERTNTNIKQLNEEETIKEIARMSSGDLNEIAIEYAKRLRSKKAS